MTPVAPVLSPDGKERVVGRKRGNIIKWLDKESKPFPTTRYFVNRWQITVFKLGRAWQQGVYPLPDPDNNAHWRGRNKKYIYYLVLQTNKANKGATKLQNFFK